MSAQISPMLAVSDPAAALDFYARAFGAETLWQIGDPVAVAGLAIDGAPIFLAHHSPDRGTRSPDHAGSTSVRIELFVDDPAATYRRAVEAGADEGSPIVEHTHVLVGRAKPLRMLQGGVVDPFGHIWLIGKFLDV